MAIVLLFLMASRLKSRAQFVSIINKTINFWKFSKTYLTILLFPFQWFRRTFLFLKWPPSLKGDSEKSRKTWKGNHLKGKWGGKWISLIKVRVSSPAVSSGVKVCEVHWSVLERFCFITTQPIRPQSIKMQPVKEENSKRKLLGVVDLTLSFWWFFWT